MDPCGHCGKIGHGPANCWTLHPDQIPWKRTAAVEEETPVGGLGFDIGCIEVAAPPGLGRTPVKIRNRFQVLEEPLEVSIGGLESEVCVQTVYQDREKLKPAGRGRITIDSGAVESVLPVGMLPGEETVEGESKRREDGEPRGEEGVVQEERLRCGQLHHVPGDRSQQAARVRQPDP